MHYIPVTVKLTKYSGNPTSVYAAKYSIFLDLSEVQKSPAATGALVVLVPPNKALSSPKLIYETLSISGLFVKFEWQAPPALTLSPLIDNFLAPGQVQNGVLLRIEDFMGE